MFSNFDGSLKDYLVNRNPNVTFSIRVSSELNNVSLELISVRRNMRCIGLGRKAMFDLLEYADEHGVTVTLTPSDVFGSDFDRLIGFYVELGFVPNNGAARVNINDTYVRFPAPSVSFERSDSV